MNASKNFEAIHHRQADIEDDRIKGLRSEIGEKIRSVFKDDELRIRQRLPHQDAYAFGSLLGLFDVSNDTHLKPFRWVVTPLHLFPEYGTVRKSLTFR